ncbi:repetitive organellar protein-like [Phymastichus coffea]|uniref:repetitive organellar protein-like n=1 Tax=Phymastichus coffea TaxID=108790 RepID=UPI00273BCDAA|nr:repetitive organellar protein-like [Phymastichus coffea]
MVGCRSCGRNIASGTLRCSKCNSAYHISCSHRYKIQDGVFSLCCGSNEPVFSTNFNYQMRTRNKRRQQQQQPKQINNFQDGSMRYGKVQKTTESMGVCDKPATLENADEITEQTTTDIIINEENDDNGNVNNFESNETEEVVEESPNNTDNNDPTNEENTPEEILNVNNDGQSKVTLETVWVGISSLQSSISNISNSLNTVSTQLNTFDPRINELESSINTIKTKTSNLENVQTDVTSLRTELERVTSELENLKSMQSQQDFDVSTVVTEIKDREIKSKNILIYNVPEDNLRISQDYSTLDDINKFNALLAARDTSRAREILQNIPDVDLDEIETRRLGRVNPNVSRPLRVTLQSREDVITVMKNRGLVNNQYNVKTDLTKIQQKKIRDLKQELERQNASGNTNLTIKFINGDPRIIPVIRRNYTKREFQG